MKSIRHEFRYDRGEDGGKNSQQRGMVVVTDWTNAVLPHMTLGPFQVDICLAILVTTPCHHKLIFLASVWWVPR